MSCVLVPSWRSTQALQNDNKTSFNSYCFLAIVSRSFLFRNVYFPSTSRFTFYIIPQCWFSVNIYPVKWPGCIAQLAVLKKVTLRNKNCMPCYISSRRYFLIPMSIKNNIKITICNNLNTRYELVSLITLYDLLRLLHISCLIWKLVKYHWKGTTYSNDFSSCISM